MDRDTLEQALTVLGERFAHRDWKYLDHPSDGDAVPVFAWPGRAEENIVICVYKAGIGPALWEKFHRQDFFFFNFAYRDSFGALSRRSDNPITVRENECYIGQPYTGYALRCGGQAQTVIIGVMIQRETFFRTFLPAMSSDARLFRFFLEPQNDTRSQDYIQLRFAQPGPIRALLELMAAEYAAPQPDTQAVLQPMALTLLMYLARQYHLSCPAPASESPAGQIVRYMYARLGTITLQEAARHFSYHPNYLSALLHHELGKTFSQLLLEQRMERAVLLMQSTSLTLEEIAAMLGYANTSNFYKAFRRYYGTSPRRYLQSGG